MGQRPQKGAGWEGLWAAQWALRRAGGRQARRALPADDECPPELRGPRAGWQLALDVLETWSALKRGLGLPGLEWKRPCGVDYRP